MSMTPSPQSSVPPKPYDSILLNHVIASALVVNPNIKGVISPDGHTAILTDITESDLPLLSFPVNNPANAAKLALKKFSVYNATQSGSPPSRVYGLVDTVQSRFAKSDFAAYNEKNATHKPFEALFNGLTLPQLTDTLSSISGETASTKNVVKNYTMVFGNDWTKWEDIGWGALGLLLL
jgi:hypothetical protein